MARSFLVVLALLPVAHAVGWDDFSNNLATDLAPFLSLFGEQVTKQFLSESTTFLDYFIFAMAPMGILTAVVSAIRVCGSPALRAFVGRAQEGGGQAEAELCSSTSQGVCEVYHNGGIARVFGHPKILEVVYDPKFNELDRPCNLSFKDYVRKTGKWYRKQGTMWPRQSKRTDSISLLSIHEAAGYDAPTPAFAPNLSLNVGIKKVYPAVFWAVAVGGFFLQAGVLVFACVATYYLHWGRDGRDREPYAYACPLVLIGTVLVCGGVYLCAYL
ncbi:hypothetical protein BDW74DRAFT_172661 [Aspergillus multicolor]|uniref:uncharacterized protein n=1 Tax=Aspergillus multicolor TaxID=41759 RepID=UPI003CCE1698